MENKKVVHHNNLANGKFEDFELRELKLFLSLLSEVKENNEQYNYNAKNIKNFIMGNKSYDDFEKIIRRLQKRIILIKENENRYETYSIFSVLKFDRLKKEIKVHYNPEFFPLISNFKNNFCKYKLKYIYPLSSKYSIMFYMMCKANQFKKKFFLSIEEMNIKIGKNLRSNNLDKLVLNPILYEINHHTDIKIEIKKEYKYLLQSKGRPKLSGYLFKIDDKEVELSKELLDAIEEAKKNVYIYNSNVLNKKTIKILLEEISEDELIKGLLYSYINIKKNFTKLQYLKTTILKYIKKSKSKNIISNYSDDNKIPEEIEMKIIDYLVSEGANIRMLKDIKKSNKLVYFNILKGSIKSI